MIGEKSDEKRADPVSKPNLSNVNDTNRSLFLSALLLLLQLHDVRI